MPRLIFVVMKRIQHIILAFLICVPAIAFAQTKTNFVTLTDLHTVGINDTLEVTFRAQGRENIVSIHPDLSGLRVISGPSETIAQAFKTVNGVLDSNNTFSICYIVKPKAVGNLTIKPAVAKTDKGVVYHTQPLTIKVVSGSVEGHEKRLPNNIDTSSDHYPTLIFDSLYNTYIDKRYGFSFNLPGTWIIEQSDSQGGDVCVSLDEYEKKEYADCFEGIIFRLEHFPHPLDSVLLDQQYTKEGATWYTTDRGTNPVKAKNITGEGWTGIYHKNICGISCKGTGFHAAAGECEFIYFSNGTTTVLIATNGKSLDPDTLKVITDSFRF